MKKVTATAAILSAGVTAASAAGIERTTQSVSPLFEDGRWAEFTISGASPSVSGTGSILLGGGASGDMSPSFLSFGAAYKADLNDTWSYAIIFDKPWGAEVDYPTGTGYFAQGSTAEFTSMALTGILQYNMDNNVSVYGGLRAQTIEAQAFVPFVTSTDPIAPNPGAPYNATTEGDWGIGYLVGVAYERPEIALRVALTYNSAIDHELDTVETSAFTPGAFPSTTEITTPESVNLEFQSGIAADTLLFGSIRWVDWSNFDISPAIYTGALDSALVSYEEDYIAYNLGVGRRFSENWAGAITLGYEPSQDFFTGNLGPTDGSASIGLAATYTKDNVEITSGVRYIMIGDAETRVGDLTPGGTFTNNDAIAFGVKVGYQF